MEIAAKLTLENMCVTGLVTLILSSPATHSKKPNTPVTKLPHANTRPFHSGELSKSDRVDSSPWKRMNGARKMAEPKFCQYAS